MKIIITIGLPASGKTSFAKEYIKNHPDTVIVCQDDLRAMLYNSHFTKENERLMVKIRNECIKTALDNGKNVIIADTNLSELNTQKYIKDYFKELYPDIEFEEVRFDTPVEECIKRDLKRPVSVGKDVILNMYYKYVAKPYDPKSGLPECIICDLDGTLAINNHNRSFYDASTCDKDDVNEVVLSILKSQQLPIIFLTGREEKYVEPTLKFLDKTEVSRYKIFMRTNNDFRKDYIIKEELFDRFIRDRYNVKFVLDDRPSVIRMWRGLGLQVLDVGKGIDF